MKADNKRKSRYNICSSQTLKLKFLRCYINILLVILVLLQFPLVSASTNVEQNKSQPQEQNFLESYFVEYMGEHGLDTEAKNQNQHPTRRPNELELYLFSSVEYVQICFSEKDPNYPSLPHLLKYRSYRPIKIQNGLPDIKCYHIFNKLDLLQQPTWMGSSRQIEALQAKKLNKQTEYLRNQYQITEWLYQFGHSISSALTKRASGKKLSLSGLETFALKLYRRDDKQIRLINAWIQKNETKNGDKIVKKLGGKGLHRRVTYKIQLNKDGKNDINTEQCEVRILETLSHKVYIDVNELESQKIKINLQAGSYGDGVNFVNIEKPAYQSRQYQYEFVIPWGAWIPTKVDLYEIELPVHYRYPTPFQLGQEKSIEYVEEELYPTTLATVVCNFPEGAQVYKLQQDYLIGKGTALLPVGDGLMKSVVSIVTLGSQSNSCENEVNLCGIVRQAA